VETTGPADSETRSRRHPPATGRRAILEPLVFVALVFAYIWIVQPTHNDWLRIPFLSVVVLIPFLSNILHRDARADLGLRLDNLGRSAREVGIATAAGAVAVVVIGLLVGAGPTLNRTVLKAFLFYPAWGLAQQYAMQAFTYRRLREGTGRPHAAAVLTAVLFASVHYPNLSLVLITLTGAYVWCRLFERHPNLLTLAVSHGWLAVLARYSWPAEWLRNLRIGPSFWTWSP
jgi:membrane protease YdiL (CAAX protease family)